MKKSNADYFAALYMRLSKEDKNEENSSIWAQKKMLNSYANENGFLVVDEYIDDGFSGTNFERPAFLRMISDIEKGKINLVITKDLSRLGRDYIKTGQYTEMYFPLKSVRYIAINDGYDSNNQNTDIAPFKNIINEMYARDISKKIRSSLEVRMKEGAYVSAFAPYGYKKDKFDKHKLVVDEPAAQIVKEIFALSASGVLPVDIARYLNQKNVLSPLEYRYKSGKVSFGKSMPKSTKWTTSTITKMLKNIVYLGHTAQGKTAKLSFKSKMVKNKSKDEWFVVYNTHSAIVSKETFLICQGYSNARISKKENEFHNIFSGIAKCGDCSKNMSSAKCKNHINLVCGKYKLNGKTACSNHFIDYNDLEKIVFESLKETILSRCIDRNFIVKSVKSKLNLYEKSEANKIDNLKKQIEKNEFLIEQVYSDFAEKLITAEQKIRLIKNYENEILNFQNKIEKSNFTPDNTDEKIQKLLDKTLDFNKLNRELIFNFIEKIEIFQGEYARDNDNKKIKTQKLKIFYRCGGESTLNQISI